MERLSALPEPSRKEVWSERSLAPECMFPGQSLLPPGGRGSGADPVPGRSTDGLLPPGEAPGRPDVCDPELGTRHWAPSLPSTP